MSELGGLTVNLAVNTAEFATDMGKAAHIAAKNMDSIERAVKKAAAAFGAMGLAAATGAAVFVKHTIDAADEMGKLAQKTGVSVESLSALKYAGSLADVSMESLSTGLKQLNKSIDNNDEAFKRLGIGLADSNGKAKTTEQVLRDVADKFSAMRDGAGKTAIAMDLFGKSGADLIPLINGGTKAFDEFTEQAKRAGVVISTEVAKAAEDFNDNMTRLNTGLQGVGMTLANPVIKNLGLMTNQMIAAMDATNSLSQALTIGFHWQPVAEQIVNVTAKLETLRNQRKQLEAENGKSSFFGLLPNDTTSAIANVDHTIAELEKKLAVLQKVRVDINKVEEHGTGAPPPRSGKDGAAEAARRAAAAEKERQRALRETWKLQEDMAKVEKDGEWELMGLRAGWAAQDAKEAADKIDRSKSEVESIRTSLLSEQDLETERFLNKQDALVAARDLEVITTTEYNDLMLNLEIEHQARIGDLTRGNLTDLEKFRALSYGKQVKTVIGMLSDMTAGVAQQNRALFEINKIAGIADVGINSIESISKAYAFGMEVGGPYAAAGMAAVAFAATAEHIAAIGSATYGGGSAPSVAGSTPAPPVSPVTSGAPSAQGNGQTTVIQIRGGDRFSRKDIRDLIDQINSESRLGGRIVVDG